MSTSKLPGCCTASPVTVVMREIKGSPNCTARYTAAAVPTFWHTSPRLAGMPPAGTSSPVKILISCFSPPRSEEHTSELQSRENLVCRLLLEKKKNTKKRLDINK